MDQFSVAVAVCTYQRRASLHRLIQRLDEIKLPVGCADLTVVVVDNDPAGSASWVETVEARRLTIIYGVEPEPGIPFARTKSIEMAIGHDFIAIIDDDEIPHASWIDELVAAQSRFDAHVVAGVVEYQFDKEPAKWIREGGFFDSPNYLGGTQLPHARTSNLLLDTRFLRRTGLMQFDPNLRFAGGSDIEFTSRLKDAGAKIVWSDTAIVTEFVPPARSTVKWSLTRAFRAGNTTAYDAMSMGRRRPGIRLRIVARGLGRIIIGLSGALVFLVARRPAMYGRWVRAACRGAGMASTALGFSYQEYRR